MLVLVKEPRHGKVVVDAGSRTSAIVQAAIAWGCTFTEIVWSAKCFIRKEDAASSDFRAASTQGEGVGDGGTDCCALARNDGEGKLSGAAAPPPFCGREAG